ncbi:MAG: acetyl-CoA C-acyltransferase, partial [Pseudomonadota bacterium]
MREAVIVSTARTALAKSVRGSFNRTHPIVIAGHALRHAIARAGIEAAEVDDVILGSGMPGGPTGFNIARNAAIQAGCPVTTSGVTINRYRSSGLQAVAFAAGRVVNEGEAVVAAGGVESISLVQMSGRMNLHHAGEPGRAAARPAGGRAGIESAAIVAERGGSGRGAVAIVTRA